MARRRGTGLTVFGGGSNQGKTLARQVEKVVDLGIRSVDLGKALTDPPWDPAAFGRSYTYTLPDPEKTLTFEKLMDSVRGVGDVYGRPIAGVSPCMVTGVKCQLRTMGERGCGSKCKWDNRPMPGMEGAIDADYREVGDELPQLPAPKKP